MQIAKLAWQQLSLSEFMKNKEAAGAEVDGLPPAFFPDGYSFTLIIQIALRNVHAITGS